MARRVGNAPTAGGDDNVAGAVGPQLGIGASGINLFAIAEDAHEKLKILDYEEFYLKPKAARPLQRTFFAIPTTPAEQFPQFSQLIMWLFKDLGVLDLEWNEFDDPNEIAKSILACAQRLGYKADIKEVNIRSGCGEHVLLLLNYVLDKTLASKRWQVQSPIYPQDGPMGALQQEPVNAGDDDAEIEDEVGEDIGENDNELDDDYRSDANGIGGNGDDGTMLGILESSIKPEEWLLELERVGPLLKIKKSGEPTKEWRTHLEQSIKHQQELVESFPQVKVSLEKLRDDLRKAIERISSREKHINQQFEHLGGEYREKQLQFEQIRTRYNELSQSVSELAQELSSKTDEVESIKASMEGRNSSMTDTAPLKRIQTALASLKKEVKHMELRIGVLGQTLLQHKVKHPNAEGTATDMRISLDAQGAVVEDDDDYDSAPQPMPSRSEPSRKGSTDYRSRPSEADDEDLELF